MINSEILEIKKRFTIKSESIVRVAGCYVNENKEKVTSFNERFAMLDETHKHKHLDILKKSMSGTLGEKLLCAPYTIDEEKEMTPYSLLMAIRASQLSDNSCDVLFDKIIEHYDHPGNYVILLYFDIYDAPVKASDGAILEDESVTYEYIICSICPMKLQKESLGYIKEDNSIDICDRDWIVDAPESAFCFPTFTDRAADIHEILLFGKKPADFHGEMFEIVGAKRIFTNTEKRQAVERTIKTTLGEEKFEKEYLFIQDELKNTIEDKIDRGTPAEDLKVTDDDWKEILTDCGMKEIEAEKLSKRIVESQEQVSAKPSQLVDMSLLSKGELLLEIEALKKENARLRRELGEK